MPVTRLILGDNLEILKGMEADSIDLIYLDPPFSALCAVLALSLVGTHARNAPNHGLEPQAWITEVGIHTPLAQFIVSAYNLRIMSWKGPFPAGLAHVQAKRGLERLMYFILCDFGGSTWIAN
jgi:hypothetical protein